MYKEYVRDKRFLISSDGKSVVKKVNQDLYKEEGGKFFIRRSAHNKKWVPVTENSKFTIIDKCIYRYIKLTPNSQGYLSFSTYIDGKSTTDYIHRAVYETFVGDIKNEIHHIDGNKHNNSVYNLEDVTHQDNVIKDVIRRDGVFKDTRRNFKYLGYIYDKCQNCGNPISANATRCIKCNSLYLSKIKTKHNKIGTKEVTKKSLIKSLTDNKGNFTKSAKEFDMTDNGLRKWCKKFGLPSKSKYWK